jgi:hypothetical protein
LTTDCPPFDRRFSAYAQLQFGSQSKTSSLRDHGDAAWNEEFRFNVVDQRQPLVITVHGQELGAGGAGQTMDYGRLELSVTSFAKGKVYESWSVARGPF